MQNAVRHGRRQGTWVLMSAAAALFGLALAVVVAGGPSSGEEMNWEEREIAIGVECLRVQVADTPEQKSQGLRGRDSMGEFDGMTFPYQTSQQRSFTMSGVKFPLTIGFYDHAGVRVDAIDMEPCPYDESSCPLYTSRFPFRVALEVNQGQLPEGSYSQTCSANAVGVPLPRLLPTA